MRDVMFYSSSIIKPGCDFSDAIIIRNSVFVEEQGFPADDEIDKHDSNAFHLIIYHYSETKKTPIACGRIYIIDNIAKIGRIAVLKEWRKQGIATKICSELEDLAWKSNVKEIHLHAETYVIALYQKLGYLVEGEPFMKGNILHITMIKKSL